MLQNTSLIQNKRPNYT